MRTEKEFVASRRGAAMFMALLLSVFLHGQVSGQFQPESRLPSYQRTTVGKTTLVARAGSLSERATKPSLPPAMLAGTADVHTGAYFYPATASVAAVRFVPGLRAATPYDARAPPAA